MVDVGRGRVAGPRTAVTREPRAGGDARAPAATEAPMSRHDHPSTADEPAKSARHQQPRPTWATMTLK